MQQQPQIQPTIYATLAGGIDQATIQRVFQGIAVAINGGVQTLHLLMQSAGGIVADGVALYNYFKNLPLDLHLYNGGGVSSIAVVAFLGARHRYASANATFMIHKTYFNVSAATNAARASGMANSLKIDDARTRAILKLHLNITDRRLEKHLVDELPFTAQDAFACGMVTAIQDFSPPAGQKLFNI